MGHLRSIVPVVLYRSNQDPGHSDLGNNLAPAHKYVCYTKYEVVPVVRSSVK